MQLSVMYEFLTSQLTDTTTKKWLIHQTLEQIELADRLVFRAMWAVKRHFLEAYTHVWAPVIL